GESHSSSAATVRISEACSSGRIRSPSGMTASSAAARCSRAMKYSDWISSPLLGVNSRRKWGRRSCAGPGSPVWSVQKSAGIPGRGCTASRARRPPSQLSGSCSSVPTTCFTQAWAMCPSQRWNRLTLLPPASIADSSCWPIESAGKSRWTVWRIGAAGTRSRVRWVTTPSVPSASTAPSKISGSASRESVSRSPPAVTISIARTVEARERWPSPEPWVPVALAPPTEMCGSEPMLGRARPRSAAARASSPYRTPAATRTVRAVVSNSRSAGIRARVTRGASLAATSENECRVPSARRRGLRATSALSSASVVGACSGPGPLSTVPDQLRPGTAPAWPEAVCSEVIIRLLFIDGPAGGGEGAAGGGGRSGVGAGSRRPHSAAPHGGREPVPPCASGPLGEAVEHLVGAQVLGEGAHRGALVDDRELEVADGGEVLPGLEVHGVAHHRVVGGAGGEPALGGGREVRLRLPDGAGHRQVRQLLVGLDHVDHVRDQAEALAHVAQRHHHGGAGVGR